MDNPKAIVRDTVTYGKGVFAAQGIKKDEVIAEFDGQIYECPFSDKDLEMHCIQFAVCKGRHSKGIARLINHSCEPNCGIQDLFKVVAMRDIQLGEEITFDYEMSENERYHPWEMECKCGTPSCRRLIRAYDYLPERIRKKYGSYISGWLRGEGEQQKGEPSKGRDIRTSSETLKQITL